jgi:hypothetical protein
MSGPTNQRMLWGVLQKSASLNAAALSAAGDTLDVGALSG